MTVYTPRKQNLTYVIDSAGGHGCVVGSHIIIVALVLPPLQYQSLADMDKLAVLGTFMIFLVRLSVDL